MRQSYDGVRRHILASGQRIIATKGFAGVGLNEILLAASVPKGSFYHYFSSKEQYGNALLAQYVADYLDKLDTLLRKNGHKDGRPAAERLMQYWKRWQETQSGQTAEEKCLVVKLSAEVADLSAEMRDTLRAGTDQVIARIAACIEEGMADGSLRSGLASAETAQQLYQMWLGASLLAKLRRDSSAFDSTLRATRATLGIHVN